MFTAPATSGYLLLEQIQLSYACFVNCNTHGLTYYNTNYFFVVLLKFGMKVMHNLRHFYSFTLRPFHSKKQMFVEEASFSSTKAMRKVKTVLIYTFGKSTLHTPRLKFIPSDIVRCCLDSSRITTLNGGFLRFTTKIKST